MPSSLVCSALTSPPRLPIFENSQVVIEIRRGFAEEFTGIAVAPEPGQAASKGVLKVKTSAGGLKRKTLEPYDPAKMYTGTLD